MYRSVCQCVCLSVSLSVCLSVYLSVSLCVSVCLSLCLSVSVSVAVSLSVCQSLCVSLCDTSDWSILPVIWSAPLGNMDGWNSSILPYSFFGTRPYMVRAMSDSSWTDSHERLTDRQGHTVTDRRAHTDRHQSDRQTDTQRL